MLEDKQIKCNKCNSTNLHWLVWVDKNNKIVGKVVNLKMANIGVMIVINIRGNNVKRKNILV